MGYNAEFVILSQTGRAYVAPPLPKKNQASEALRLLMSLKVIGY